MEKILQLVKDVTFALTAESSGIFEDKAVRAPYIDRLLGTEKVRGEYRAKYVLSEDGMPLLLGLTEDPASRQALSSIGKNEWIIDSIDGKLVVNGWFDNAVAAGFRRLMQLRESEAAAALPITGKMEGYFDFPDCDCGTFAGGMDEDRGTALYRYTDICAADFDRYCEKLTAAGFVLAQSSTIGQHRFATYIQDEQALILSWLSSRRELRIVADRADRQGSAFIEPVAATHVPQVSLVNLYNHYVDGNDIGLCLIFTLCDGSLMVVDGGYMPDAQQLYRAMVRASGSTDGCVTVAAWLFTHDHADHTGAFAKLAELPEAKKVTVERILYNGSGDSFLWRSRHDPYHYAVGEPEQFAPGRMEMLAENYGGQTQSIRPHMGQRLCFRDATVEFLCTGTEDLFPRLVDNFNDTSLVFKVTLGGQTVLVLGDAAADAGKMLTELFDGCLDCDILQVSHHGCGGMIPELYPAIQTDVALWSTTWKTIERNDFFNRPQNAGLRAKQTVVADGVMQVLQLPYDPEKDAPQVVSIGDYALTKEEKYMILPRVRDMQMQEQSIQLPRKITLCAESFGEKAVKLLPLLLPQCSAELTEVQADIRCRKAPELPAEGYTVTAEQDAVHIGYADYLGLRNALAAISQLVRLTPDGMELPELTLRDAPVCNHRGVMLDAARGVKDYDQFCRDMVLMAKARMNVLHIHINDGQGFGIRLDSLPEGVCWADAYTKDQVRQLVELADILGLELIPEIDIPAHGTALLRQLPQMRCNVDPETHPSLWVVCPGKEETFRVLEQVIREVCDLFPGRYFHMGGDELDFADAPKINQLCYWDECPDCKKRMEQENLADRSELYYYFVKRIHAVVTDCGRRMVMWSDQLDADKTEQLPRDIIMQYWRTAGKGRGPVHSCTMQEQLALGHQVINSRYQDTYIDIESYISEKTLKDWRWDRRPECDSALAENILGSELCCWEYGNEPLYPHYWTSLPSGIFMMADKLWNGDDLFYSRQYAEALTRAVLGVGVPENFNIWNCFGGLIPPRTGKINIYKSATARQPEKEYVLQVLGDEGYFAYSDFVRACAYKARLEGKALSIPEPSVEPED